MQPLCVSSKSGGGFHFFNKCGEALEHHRDIAEVLRDHLSNGRSGNGAVCTCFKRSTDMFRARYAKPQKQWRRAGSAKCSNFDFTGTPGSFIRTSNACAGEEINISRRALSDFFYRGPEYRWAVRWQSDECRALWRQRPIQIRLRALKSERQG